MKRILFYLRREKRKEKRKKEERMTKLWAYGRKRKKKKVWLC